MQEQQLQYIEYREIAGEQVACVIGRLEVWQVMMVARGYEFDVAKTAVHLDLLPEQVQAAFAYAGTHPVEINSALAENDEGFARLKRILPNIERVTLPEDDVLPVRPAVDRSQS